MTETSWRDTLRDLPVFHAELPGFDTTAAPAAPTALLTEWLREAIDADVAQPHAMTVATADADGAPSARTLLLKDVTNEGLWFASLTTSPKGREIEANPRAALTLYWREQGRQVRVTGSIERGPATVSAADWLARSVNARAVALAGQESGVLQSPELFAARVEEAKAILDFRPDYVPEEWASYIVRPQSMEFWQAARERDQIRLSYTREGSGWRRDLLWP